LQPSGYGHLLRSNESFRRIWIGDAISFLGDWFSLLALYTAVQSLTDSTFALAGVLIGKTLPMFFMTPLAGPLVDRMDRRFLMIASNLGRAVLALGLLAAWWMQHLAGIYILLSAQVALSGIFTPARAATIPRVVAPINIPVAMALSGGTWSIMLGLGAALGGVATEFLGIEGALILDMLTFLVSAWILRRLPALPPEKRDGDNSGFVDGLRYVRRNPMIARILSVKPGLNLQSAALVFLPVLGTGVYPGFSGPMWVGALYSVRGLGAMVGSFQVRRWVGDTPRALATAIPVSLIGAGICFYGISASNSIWLTSGLLFFAAVGTAVGWVFSGTLLQLATEDHVRGRVFSLEWGGATLASAIGSGVSGGLTDALQLDYRVLFVVAGTWLILFASGWWIIYRRSPAIEAAH